MILITKSCLFCQHGQDLTRPHVDVVALWCAFGEVERSRQLQLLPRSQDLTLVRSFRNSFLPVCVLNKCFKPTAIFFGVSVCLLFFLSTCLPDTPSSDHPDCSGARIVASIRR